MNKQNLMQGMYAMALYAVIQSLVWALVRYLSDDLSTATLFFFRNLIGFATAVPFLIKGGFSLFRTSCFQLHALRAFVALTGGFAVFYAVAHAPLATVVAITYTAPIFASLFAMIVYSEGITLLRIGVLVVGFFGTMMVLRPSFDAEILGLVGAVIAAVTTAAAFLLVKKLSRTERTETITAYPFLLILPISAVLAALDWTMPSLVDLPLLVLMGIGISAGQYFMARAFGKADASAVLPIDFLRLLVAAFVGVAAFSDTFDMWVIVGALVILAATIYGARAERRYSLQAAK
jgi:drug/metabolite transporter (DMT)-like permease